MSKNQAGLSAESALNPAWLGALADELKPALDTRCFASNGITVLHNEYELDWRLHWSDLFIFPTDYLIFAQWLSLLPLWHW